MYWMSFRHFSKSIYPICFCHIICRLDLQKLNFIFLSDFFVRSLEMPNWEFLFESQHFRSKSHVIFVAHSRQIYNLKSFSFLERNSKIFKGIL